MNKRVQMVLMAGIILSLPARSELIINEIMQSNVNCIMDDLNEYPDSWIELYNTGNEEISLAGYAIGDKDKIKKAYNLPSGVTVAPQGHILIYCDKVGSGMHSSFRLESGKGCNVYLFKGEEIIDKIENLKKMPAPDISYGRVNDGDEEWGYQLIATPGASNNGDVTENILGEPIFSVKGRVLTNPVTLNISLPSDAPEKAVIRYTTDGSDPTINSPLYNGPIPISDNTVIRAKLFADGFLSPMASTHSYIFHGYDITIPIVSLVGNENDFYSNEKGILSDYIGESGSENYKFDWRRPINIEYFTAEDEDACLNQIGETRVKGYSSRSLPLKSMVVYANKRFGEKRLDYEFFPNQKPGVTDFKSIELRNAGGDYNFTYMKDAAIQRIMGENTLLDWQANQPTVVYLNGKYMGILNLRERANEDYIYTHYDGLEDVDIIENWGQSVEEGDIDNFNLFKEFYSQEGHTYEEFAERMDIPEFCNYFIMEIFFDNKDWPGTNCIMWRSQEDNGIWRWIAKDLDMSFGIWNWPAEFPTFEWLYDENSYPEYNGNNNAAPYTLLLRRILEVPEVKKEFIDRFLVYMGDFLNKDYISEILDDQASMLEVEFPRHKIQNIDPQYWEQFDMRLENMKIWAGKRRDYMFNHIAEFFEMNNPLVPLTINGENSAVVDMFSINGIDVVNNIFDGKYFVNTPMVLKIDSENVDNVIWMLIINNNEYDEISELSGKEVTFTIPENAENVVINIFATSGVPTLSDKNNNAMSIDFTQPYDIYDIQGRKISSKSLTELTNGVYILRQNNISMKYVK